MIVGTGIDISEVARIAASISRYGDRFLHRVFTPAEIAYCNAKKNAAERFAARFAAKEAALKALGTGLRHGITWQDVEVLRMPGSRPGIRFSGRAAEFARQLGAERVSLSITHTNDTAMAMVILESRNEV